MTNGEMRDAQMSPPVPERGPGLPSAEKEAPKEALPMPQEKAKEKEKASEPVVAPAVSAAPAGAAPALTKDQNLMKVERILEDNLSDIYFKLSPELRGKFKAKGEETAAKINTLMESAKVGARAVLALIREWLKMIPGVNSFFLEQEAKIKTDRLMTAREERRNKGLS